jgi:glycosyltransferase involved in cell wall biosynthesis
VSDVSPLMNISDLSINCSIGTETSSLALSEGMSLGLPAVVSDYGGNPYMIKHRVNGFVCKTGDSEKMAEYIVRLKNDRELYSKMSEKARERFENELNARSMTQKTNRLYDTLHESMSQSRISKS